MDQYADALKKGSDNGGVTAIFDEVPYLRLFLSRYCEGYSMAGPTYKSGGFGFVFPMGSPLAVDVSRAILELAEEDKLARIENKWFGHPGACVGRAAVVPMLGWGCGDSVGCSSPMVSSRASCSLSTSLSLPPRSVTSSSPTREH